MDTRHQPASNSGLSTSAIPLDRYQYPPQHQRIVPSNTLPGPNMNDDAFVHRSRQHPTEEDVDMLKADSAKLNGNKHTVEKNPVLLDRVTALSGGFRWAAFGRKKQKTEPQPPLEPESMNMNISQTTRIGSFPMPSLVHGKSNVSPDLVSYKNLWQSLENDPFQREIFSRRLHRYSEGVIHGNDGKDLSKGNLM